MKKLLSILLIMLSISASGQRDIHVTRTTHLLRTPNQATFDHQLTVPAGAAVFVFRYRNDYYQVRYKYQDYFVFYPYLDELEEINEIRKELLTGVPAERRYSQQKAGTYQAPYRVIHTGPRGGRYYINKNGNKTYIKRN